MNEFLARFGVEDKDDIDDIIAKLGCSHVLMTMHKTKTDELNSKLDSVKQELDGVRKQIAEITEPCGCSSAREAIPVILKALSDEEALLQEKEKYTLARDTLKSTVSLDERQHLLDIISGRPYSEDSFDKELIKRQKEKAEQYRSSISELEEKAKELEKEIAVLTATLESPSIIADRLKCVSREIEEAKKKHAALCLAYEALSLASDDLRSQIAPRLSRSAGDMMSGLTDGRYSVLGVDSELQMEYRAQDGRTHSIDYMSYGTKELAYISLRIALTDVLFSREHPPVVFDESFSCIDDTRLAELFRLIEKSAGSNSQIIILTSQKRDSAIAEENEIDYTYTLL